MGRSMQNLSLRSTILKNRFTVLLTTLAVYMTVLVTEGALTGREARVVEFENPFFDLQLNELEEFGGRREGRRDRRGNQPQLDTGDA
jgi:hypothetical protein